MKRFVLVQGASRGLGNALVGHYLNHSCNIEVIATCRNPMSFPVGDFDHHKSRLHVVPLDVSNEKSIVTAAQQVKDLTRNHGIQALFNVAGILNDDSLHLAPERRLAEIKFEQSMAAFAVNSIGPVIVAKNFSPLLYTAAKNNHVSTQSDDTILPHIPVMVFFSARVGSIEDNHTGGWYTYRASKAALNQFVRSAAFELKRKHVCAIALHPGTVDTDLTRKHLKARSKYTVQPVQDAAANIVNLARTLDLQTAGSFLDQNGKIIPW